MPVREKRGRLAHHLAYGTTTNLLLVGYRSPPHETANATTQTDGGVGLGVEAALALFRAEILPLERTVRAGPFGDDLVDQVLHLLRNLLVLLVVRAEKKRLAVFAVAFDHEFDLLDTAALEEHLVHVVVGAGV